MISTFFQEDGEDVHALLADLRLLTCLYAGIPSQGGSSRWGTLSTG